MFSLLSQQQQEQQRWDGHRLEDDFLFIDFHQYLKDPKIEETKWIPKSLLIAWKYDMKTVVVIPVAEGTQNHTLDLIMTQIQSIS